MDQKVRYRIGEDMTDEDKMLAAAAKVAGFRTYLYFVATEKPVVNLASWSAEDGFALHCATEALPKWFLNDVYNPFNEELT